MPINKRGGKGHKRGKKMTSSSINTALTYKDTSQNQEYGKVISTLGDCRLSVQLIGVEPSSSVYSSSNKPMICKIPGAFRKKIFINKGDYILVSVRDYQKDHVDVLTKYSHAEALTLMKQGEIPMDDGLSAGTKEDDDGPDFVVVAEGDDKDKKEEMDTKITKDDSWYNSILPPTDSDSDSEDGTSDKQKSTKANMELNKRGLKLKDGPTKPLNQKSTQVTFKPSSSEEEEEVEEIDLETL